MKTKIFLVFTTIAAFFLSSCQKTGFKPMEKKWEVALNSCSAKATNPYVCFDSLITDSRCPLGGECIWQGTAIIKVSFSENGNFHQIKMSLQGFPSLGFPSDTTINGYRIIFLDLKPYPDLNSSNSEKPVAYLSITR